MAYENETRFHIVYPSGDKTKLTVAEVYPAYEINDYAVASKRNFIEEDDANKYCRQLANENNLICDIDGDEFLD